MLPEAYLHQGEGICQFAIAQNPLDSRNNGNFIFGGLFLKHFYSIYDFDQELISLGVNTHSVDIVQMFPKGEKGKVLVHKNKTAQAAAVVQSNTTAEISQLQKEIKENK